MTEAELQVAVAQYLRVHYPGVIFHSDFGSGAKLTPGQAVRQKKMNGGQRAWPDMFIAEPVGNGWYGVGEDGKRENLIVKYCGLFLELKKEGTRLKKKDGTWATPHIAEQAEMLAELRKRGYAAEFAVGSEEARKILDQYLKIRT